MKTVGKYNLFKGISTVLTIGAPITTLACCGESFMTTPKATLSAAGVFTILFAALAFKDKMAENFKAPSAFMVATITLIFIVLVESIMQPVKYVCIVTMCTAGLDEVTFKQYCKALELSLPKEAQAYKHVGFIFCKTTKLEEINET